MSHIYNSYLLIQGSLLKWDHFLSLSRSVETKPLQAQLDKLLCHCVLAGDAHLLLVDVCQEDTLGFVGGFIQRVLPIFSLHQPITQDMVIYMA
ncbi:hypothetical protein NP493_407g02029 [Ridgeia piscesae]|uniref:Uncharacterized protein n=1 Tax=Ridgeia piscesae TaxID=27915 RepID=A0AAD9L176_RIDPI|nr:hypothetical protein NP493_407g02029 [Ridgeia piscesae]